MGIYHHLKALALIALMTAAGAADRESIRNDIDSRISNLREQRFNSRTEGVRDPRYFENEIRERIENRESDRSQQDARIADIKALHDLQEQANKLREAGNIDEASAVDEQIRAQIESMHEQVESEYNAFRPQVDRLDDARARGPSVELDDKNLRSRGRDDPRFQKMKEDMKARGIDIDADMNLRGRNFDSQASDFLDPRMRNEMRAQRDDFDSPNVARMKEDSRFDRTQERMKSRVANRRDSEDGDSRIQRIREDMRARGIDVDRNNVDQDIDARMQRMNEDMRARNVNRNNVDQDVDAHMQRIREDKRARGIDVDQDADTRMQRIREDMRARGIDVDRYNVHQDIEASMERMHKDMPARDVNRNNIDQDVDARMQRIREDMRARGIDVDQDADTRMQRIREDMRARGIDVDRNNVHQDIDVDARMQRIREDMRARGIDVDREVDGVADPRLPKIRDEVDRRGVESDAERFSSQQRMRDDPAFQRMREEMRARGIDIDEDEMKETAIDGHRRVRNRRERQMKA